MDGGSDKRVKTAEQLEFAGFAFCGGGGAGTGKDAPEGRGANRGASRGIYGAVPGAGGNGGSGAGAAASGKGAGGGEGKKGRYLAVVYREEDDGRGNLTLRKVTTSRYVTVGQIAATLGVSDQAIYQRVSAGEFDGGPQPVDRIGAAIRIPVETFLRWKERHVTGAEYERPQGRPFGTAGDE